MVRALPGHAPGRPGEQPVGEIPLSEPRISGPAARCPSLAAVRHMLRAIRLKVVRHTTIMTLAPAARQRILATSARSGPR